MICHIPLTLKIKVKIILVINIKENLDLILTMNQNIKKNKKYLRCKKLNLKKKFSPITIKIMKLTLIIKLRK